MPRYVKVVTLGCPKNTVDSRQMTSYFVQEGYELTDDAARADIILINTCCFIEDSKREAIATILEMARWKKFGNCEYLIVAGCLAQKYTGDLIKGMPEVDLLLGTGDIPALPALLKEIPGKKATACVGSPNSYIYDEGLPVLPEQVGHYAYLKIAEGCGNSCSYCVIPSIRGAYRSRRFEDILHEAASLVEAGARELILVAQDTTQYGRDIDGTLKLPDLLKSLSQIPNLSWIRLLYTYPAFITDRLLQTITAEDKICKYLDIPLQHISDRILKKMGRTFGREDTVKLLERVRYYVPGVTLRSTFIVGFPGETRDDFKELLAFLADTGFDRTGFFAYSREPDTPAAKMPGQVGREEKIRRLSEAQELQGTILARKQAAFVGKKVIVMADGPSPDYAGLWEGRTAGDAPEIDGVVYFKPDRESRPGKLLSVLVTHAQDYALMGEIRHESSQ